MRVRPPPHWWLLVLFGNPCECGCGRPRIGGCLPYLATPANAGVATPALVAACLIWQPMRMPGWPRRHWWLLALFGNPCECRGCSAGIGGCLPYLATHANAGAAAPALVAACLIWQPMRTPGLQRRHWWLLALFGNPCECRGGHAGIGGCLPYLATYANAGVATPGLVAACLIWHGPPTTTRANFELCSSTTAVWTQCM